MKDYINDAARQSAVSSRRIVRMELERARKMSKRLFLRLAGKIAGPSDLSTGKASLESEGDSQTPAFWLRSAIGRIITVHAHSKSRNV